MSEQTPKAALRITYPLPGGGEHDMPFNFPHDGDLLAALGLAAGGLYSPDDDLRPELRYGIVFLEAVARCVPEVQEKLHRDVFRHTSTAEIGRFFDACLSGVTGPPGEVPPELAARLETWAAECHLAEYGLAAMAAILRLHDWAHSPEQVQEATLMGASFQFLVALAVGGSQPQAVRPPPTLDVPGWMLHGTWGDYEKAALEQLTQQLRAYRDEQQRTAEADGWQPLPRKYARKDAPDKHFEWLARYQCGGEKQLDIAERERVSGQSVSDAVRGVAALIGLPLREGRAAPRQRSRRNRGR